MEIRRRLIRQRKLLALVALILIGAAMGPAPLRAERSIPAASKAPTATISGTLRRADTSAPVSGVTLHVNWDGGGQTTTTDGAGTYTVSGVPSSGPVQILVRPPIAARLAFRNWGGADIGAGVVKDFDLVPGYRLQGAFRQPDGAPYSGTFWLGVTATEGAPPPNEWVGDTAINGVFDLVLPQGYRYLIAPSAKVGPYFAPFTKVDLAHDVTGLTIDLLDSLPEPYPTAPPRAAAISVGSPDLDGMATVTGAAGAVDPLAAVMLVNLNAGNLMTATADAGGAFSARMFLPPGSTLGVKYDRTEQAVQRLWQDALAPVIPDISYVSVLPGTLMSTNPPPHGISTTPFRTAGGFRTEAPTTWAGWALDGALHLPPGTAVNPGDRVDFDARLRVTMPGVPCTEPVSFNPNITVHLRYLFDAEGQSDPWGIWFNAHIFTPTGLPIEHEADGQVRNVGVTAFSGLHCISDHAFEGVLESSFQVPADLPDGTYQVEGWIYHGGASLTPNLPIVPIWYHFSNRALLMPLTVGTPDAPRIPWTLLGDDPVNGHRGVTAREDEGVFAMPTRIVYPPTQVVIPRTDARTGAPISYRLEPGSHWLSGNDRRLPTPPRIPMAFPSGSLQVEVHRPDGHTDVLGPAPLAQASARTPTLPGGTYLDFGTGHICDLYHVTTMAEAFDYSFDEDGHHVIVLEGRVDDIYGNSYAIDGTYDVYVGRVLDLDPGQLPTTPYEQGDHFAPGLHVFPPVPADVEVRVLQLPDSDPSRAIETVITGQANRFGIFQPPVGTAIPLTAPGEFRVDITAVYAAPDGTEWRGAVTWGNVVEGPGAAIAAHGRRGMDYKSETISDMPAWFNLAWLQTHPVKQGIEVYYPYFSGDIHWGNEDRALGDSIHSIITVEDLAGYDGPIYNLLRAEWPTRNGFRWPPEDTSLTGLNKRLAVGEAPLTMSTFSGIDPGVEPTDIDLFAYWYGSSERPDVHVREIISEDDMGTAYWRFDDTYGYQIGEGAKGDLPGDLKWEFGGAVLRYLSPTRPINEYAIYSSLWVLLPHDDPMGVRITPPFRGAGALDGGPIMELAGKAIDMLFLPKGVRPGDVLEVGDTVAFSGHVGPPLDSRVGVTITAPSGVRHAAVLRASKVGWVYDPSFDFAANEAGRWTVDVQVVHDRPYAPTGLTPTAYNTGTVLGTEGRYAFYVVAPSAPRLRIVDPAPGYLVWPEGWVQPFPIAGWAPPGTTAVYYTIHDKGVVMGQGTLVPDATGTFTLSYDARALNAVYPFVSLTAHEGDWEGLADEVAINLLAVGSGPPQATTVTLIGEEVFVEQTPLRWVYLPLALRP